jgi:hypothetical protein
MLKSILNRFGYKLVKSSDEPRELIQAFALEIEEEHRAAEYFGDVDDPLYGETRFELFDSLTGFAQQLTEMVYAEKYEGQAEDVRNQCAAVGAIAMYISKKFGDLLPRPVKA